MSWFVPYVGSAARAVALMSVPLRSRGSQLQSKDREGPGMKSSPVVKPYSVLKMGVSSKKQV